MFVKPALLAALLITATTQSALALDYPSAARQPVVNTYHGVAVTDDYQWLEDGDSAATRKWVAGENALSRQWLDAVPGRAALHTQINALITSNSNAYFDLVERGGVWFAMKRQPPKQQPLLVTLSNPDDLASEKVVLDPNTLSADGTVTIDFYMPSNDGGKVAVSLSEKGSEDGTLHVFDTATGKDSGDRVPRAAYPTGGGTVAWDSNGSGLYYTRYPAPGERAEADIHFYQQVYFHALGTDARKDRYEAGKDFPRIAETRLSASRDGRYLAVMVANGDGGDAALYFKNTAGGGWRKLAADADGVKNAVFGEDGYLYLLSRAAAPRGKVLRLDLRKPDLAHAQTVMAQGEGTIDHFVVGKGRLYVAELVGGPSQLLEVDLRTKAQRVLPTPAVSGVDDLAVDARGRVLAHVTSYLNPMAWYSVDDNTLNKTALAVTSAADYGDSEIVREFATSKDGTQIPLNILKRKGTKLDGSNPTLLYGYGGYGVSMTPFFSAASRVWLARGGVYVIANIRGGGEFGEAWHLAGNLTHKQTVFDDFIASAQYLEKAGYTSPQKLAIMGGSNGGLLMGAALTQRPDLYRAVVSSVGIYDMLRVELDPNGAFNVTEFGSVKDPAQFAALYAYSPLHHVKDGTAYPSILMLTGDHDGRVNPAHSRKMIARLQAANPSGNPVLLRTSASSGHGMGTALSELIDQVTDQYAFLMHELGMAIE
ncbi:prolyl oligopeptidase family serine peptidase [Amantichitinum ursilacus]|uniref:prolyl oligopeptidase n=1 Tax=Amantichitinum ursilacus TaxID=857265 RepID=A0A0N1JSI1_9NEIS|nr:prolyl oligopeptidase family serine peptidase [Amantichitinum ursilacus]KPC52768.1 Prolyl endopeptidase [Amantichitinum ursilacus]